MHVVRRPRHHNQQPEELDQKRIAEENQSKEFMAWYRRVEKVEKLVEREGWIDGKGDVESRTLTLKPNLVYWSKNCQSRSWREGHKFECKIFGGLHPRILPSIVRAVVQILKLRSSGHIEERRWQDFLSLESHEQDLLNAGGGERCQDIYLMSKAAQKYSGTKEPLELFSNHSASRSTLSRRCSTTAASPTVKSKSTPILGSISIDILRPISEGDELTISYIDNTQPRARRQADLAARYFFTCTCSRCSRGSKTPFDRMLVSAESAEASKAKAHATNVLDASLSREQNQNHSSLIPAMSSALSQLAQSRTFPIHRYPGAQLRLQLVLALIEAGNWRDATLQSAIIVYRIDPVLYPKQHHHPRDRKGMEERLTKMWNEVIDTALKREQIGFWN
ncbi:hypothetical protein DV736_g4621, partial [Chaetothyriales sp. CBS 134916]